MARRRHDGPVVSNACAHLPAARVVVGHSAIRVTGHDRVAAAMSALEHPVGVGAKGLEAAASRDNLGGHGEDKTGEGKAVGDGCEDGLSESGVSKSRLERKCYSLASAFWRSWTILRAPRKWKRSNVVLFCQDIDIFKE